MKTKSVFEVRHGRIYYESVKSISARVTNGLDRVCRSVPTTNRNNCTLCAYKCLPLVLVALCAAVLGARAQTCEDGGLREDGGLHVALTQTKYLQGYSAYKDMTCIPKGLFKEFQGKVTLRGMFTSLKTIGDEAFTSSHVRAL
jgi:hypothetical protein